MKELEKEYERKRPALERTVERLKSLLLEVVWRIEDRKLVRARFGDVRAKSLPSLKRKAKNFGWTPEEALQKCADLVGGRVVCNNVEDVYRFEELLRECLPIVPSPHERQDYISKPTKQGYRALHLNFRLNVAEGFGIELVPCEVQIRSRLQDTWAELSHADFYKQDNLPPDLCDRVRALSRLLVTADKIASDIRVRAQQVTEPPEKRPSLNRLSSEGIAYVFKDVFGRAPPDYAVTMALNLCKDLGVISLRELPNILKRQEFRDKLGKTYTAIIPVSIDSETMLLAALHALAGDDRKAVDYVHQQAQREWDEIDNIAQREMLSELPATVEELIEELEDQHGETDIVSLAEALGASNNCAYCGATVIDPYSFAEAAIGHYELSDDESEIFERIENAIFGSDVDIGDPDDPSACSHYAASLAKDD